MNISAAAWVLVRANGAIIHQIMCNKPWRKASARVQSLAERFLFAPPGFAWKNNSAVGREKRVLRPTSSAAALHCTSKQKQTRRDLSAIVGEKEIDTRELKGICTILIL